MQNTGMLAVVDVIMSKGTLLYLSNFVSVCNNKLYKSNNIVNIMKSVQLWCSEHEEDKDHIECFVCKQLGRQVLERLRMRWGNESKMDLKERCGWN